MSIINTVVKGGGTTPTGTIQITTNGTHDVTSYATADVQVPTTAPASYRAFRVDNNGVLTNSTSTPWVPLPAGTTDLYSNILGQAYASTPANILSGTIDLSSLTTISGSSSMSSCFYGCTGITSVNLSSLTTISGASAMSNCFYGCTGITSVDFLSLTTISGNNAMSSCFTNCTSLISVDFSSLTTISGNNAMSSGFYGCTGITSVNLSSLTTISGNYAMSSCFANCTSLTSLSFPALTSTSFGTRTNQFTGMLSGVTGCTVHFPMAIQSTIGSWADVTNGFGGTNTTVLFDIVTSLTGADSNTYTRSQKNSTSTATAWTYNDTLYYTSGTTEPAVSDTIYSDAACTTAVTTISAIA